MEADQAVVETIPAPESIHTETPHGGGAPVSQTTNLYPQSAQPDAMGITGYAARVAGVSILAIFMTLYLIDRWDERMSKQRAIQEQRDDKERERQELRDDRKARADQVDKAHSEFKELSARQWVEVQKHNETTKQLGEEVKKMGEKVDLGIKNLTDEVKRRGMGP